MEHNERSTCEWVDEAYSKRLWGRMVKHAASIPDAAPGSLTTVRKYAFDVWKKIDKTRIWGANLYLCGPRGALDMVVVNYDRNGRFLAKKHILRISQHAGQRLFERLRTNSDDDLHYTVCSAVFAVFQAHAIDAHEWIKKHGERYPEGFEVRLPWGKLFLAPDSQENIWVAKTFIPMKEGEE